jgi:hypothetical protein
MFVLTIKEKSDLANKNSGEVISIQKHKPTEQEYKLFDVHETEEDVFAKLAEAVKAEQKTRGTLAVADKKPIYSERAFTAWR